MQPAEKARRFGDDLADSLVPLTCDGPGGRQNIVVDGNLPAHRRLCDGEWIVQLLKSSHFGPNGAFRIR
jgi:hypothetical protein